MIQRYSALKYWKTHIDEDGKDGELVLYDDHLAAMEELAHKMDTHVAKKDREIAALRERLRVAMEAIQKVIDDGYPFEHLLAIKQAIEKGEVK